MMKKRKFVGLMCFLYLFATFLALSGCKAQNTSGEGALQQEGAVVYEEMILSEKLSMTDITSAALGAGKEIVVFREDERKFVILDKDGNVSREFSPDSNGRVVFDCDGNGNIFVLTQEYERNDNNETTAIKRKLTVYDDQGKRLNKDDIVKELGDGKADVRDEIIRKILVDSKGRIYVLKLDKSIEVFDGKLNSINALKTSEYSDMAIDEGDNLIVLSRGQNIERVIEKLDGTKYQSLWKREYADEVPWHIYYNKSSKLLYGLNDKSILCYGPDGTKKDKLLDYSSLSIIEYTDSFIVDDKAEIYLMGVDREVPKLIRYVKTDKKTADQKEVNQKELTFEVFLDAGNIISNAARAFEKQHPDIRINITDTRDIPYDEYQQKLNTALLTGKGPDMVCGFSHSDYDYIQKGLLVNFDELIKNDSTFNMNDYYDSILNGSRHQGGLYTIPLMYMFDCFLVNEKLLKENDIVIDDNWTWGDFYAIAQKLNNNNPGKKYYALPKMINPWIPLDSIVFQDLDYYVDRESKTARFNSKEFIDALKLYQAIRDGGIIHPETEDFSIIDSRGKTNTDHFIFIPMTFNEYGQIRIFGKCFNGNFKVLPMPKGLHADTRYFAGKNVFINNSSKYKKEAWEFIKYLLSEEVQERFCNQGEFVLNIKAEDKYIRDILAYQEKNKSQEYYNVTEQDVEQVRHLIKDVFNNNRTQGELNTIIWQELEPFMNKERDAEETAKLIQNKVELYLKE